MILGLILEVVGLLMSGFLCSCWFRFPSNEPFFPWTARVWLFRPHQPPGSLSPGKGTEEWVFNNKPARGCPVQQSCSGCTAGLGLAARSAWGCLSLGTEIKTNVRVLPSCCCDWTRCFILRNVPLCAPGAGKIKVDGAPSRSCHAEISCGPCTGCLKQDNEDGGAVPSCFSPWRKVSFM